VQLSLGFRSKVIWENNVWGYRRFRLCSTQCIDLFMQKREALQAQKIAIAQEEMSLQVSRPIGAASAL
jgi:hypothetical protein